MWGVSTRPQGFTTLANSTAQAGYQSALGFFLVAILFATILAI